MFRLHHARRHVCACCAMGVPHPPRMQCRCCHACKAGSGSGQPTHLPCSLTPWLVKPFPAPLQLREARQQREALAASMATRSEAVQQLAMKESDAVAALQEARQQLAAERAEAQQLRWGRVGSGVPGVHARLALPGCAGQPCMQALMLAGDVSCPQGAAGGCGPGPCRLMAAGHVTAGRCWRPPTCGGAAALGAACPRMRPA